MKFSNEEKKMAEFILDHRNVLGNGIEDTLKPFKFILVDNVKDGKIKAKMVNLLKYLNRLDLIEYFNSWEIPIFPITGDMLIGKNVKKGPLFSKVLNTLKEMWKNEFEMNTSEDTKNKLLIKCDDLIANS